MSKQMIEFLEKEMNITKQGNFSTVLIPPSKHTFSIVMEGFRKSFQLSEMREWFQIFRSNYRVLPNSHVFRCILETAAYLGQYGTILHYWEKLKSLRPEISSEILLNTIDTLANENVLQVLAKSSNNSNNNNNNSSSSSSSSSSSNSTDGQLISWINKMKAERIPISNASFAAIVTHYASLGDVSGMIHWIGQMQIQNANTHSEDNSSNNNSNNHRNNNNNNRAMPSLSTIDSITQQLKKSHQRRNRTTKKENNNNTTRKTADNSLLSTNNSYNNNNNKNNNDSDTNNRNPNLRWLKYLKSQG